MCYLCELANVNAPALTGTVDKVSLSLKDGAQRLLQPNSSWTYNNNLTTEITYGFRSNAPTYNTSQHNQQNSFERVSISEMAMVREALSAWSNVANIKFVEVNTGGYTDAATMLFGNYISRTDGSNGFAYYPSSKNTAPSSREGDVWLNNYDGSFFNVQRGKYDFATMLHEIGHALGLSHPGDYNAGSGITLTYANNAEFREDTRQYTVMSYFQASELGADHGSQYTKTPLLLDMIAIQQIYGFNTTGSSGDDIYGFSSTRGPTYLLTDGSDKAVFSIWDSGGVDMLDVSQYTSNQKISLVDASFSDIGGLTKNISIAAGAVVENARGGSGDDIITGNYTGNSLWGGSGDDQLNGGSGNDRLYGEDGNDILVGGRGDDVMDGGAGSDIAAYLAIRGDYSVSKLADTIVVRAKAEYSDGVDTLVHVERIDFTDGDLVFDVTSSNAPAAYRLYGGAFARTPDEGGFRFWTSTLDANVSLRDVATQFIGSGEFIGRYGASLSNAAFVDALYQNVLSRGGDAGGVAHWNRMLDNKYQDRADVLVEFTQLPEFVGISAANITNGYWVV
jgi:serralysin